VYACSRVAASRASVSPFEWIPEERQPTSASPGSRRAVEDGLLRGESGAGPRQIEPADHVGHHRGLAADELHVGEFGAAREPLADLLGEPLVRLVDGEVVDERDGGAPRAATRSLTFIAMQSIPTVE